MASDAFAADAARQLGRVKVKPLNEISGIAVSRLNPEIVWMHNDGESKQIYAVRTSGEVAAQLRAPRGIQDLEDIALGPAANSDRDYLYLGDIGDNDGDRRTIQVFRFREPLLGSSGQEYAEEVEVITLMYPDGPHDAEALLVDPATGDIIIATKEERGAHVYLAAGTEAATGRPIVLRKIARLDLDEVSAGDFSRDGQFVALRSEEQGWLWERQPSEPLKAMLARAPRIIPVLGRKQGRNGEAIAFAADGASYITMSEGKNESMYSFPVLTDAP
ncbi:MAG TPA: hypothetical protein VF175_04730 [Lacipirellula sp.]